MDAFGRAEDISVEFVQREFIRPAAGTLAALGPMKSLQLRGHRTNR